MKFGIYVHIPYCLQRCPYCDFATYQKDQILPPKQYVQYLIKEIELQSSQIPPHDLESIYFGGGTPSLLEAEDILAIITTIEKVGFTLHPNTEITIEINPGTLIDDKLDHLIDAGVNRFSVGAQTFNRSHIKNIGREHDEDDTIRLLENLKDRRVNFSVDLLFALPNQSIEQLNSDIDQILQFSPPHISPYCLTVPTSNPLAAGQPEDEAQIEMFALIYERLQAKSYRGYEISNFALSGSESRHNLLYWTDNEYLGFGLSAHSYMRAGEFGVRFWNPRGIGDYLKQIDNTRALEPWKNLKNEQFEFLTYNEALTDFCHTALRTSEGLNFDRVQQRFGNSAVDLIHSRLNKLPQPEHVELDEDSVRLTFEGRLSSNKILEILHFSS